MTLRVSLGLVVLFETLVFAQVAVPPISPQVTGTFPHGGQRGKEIEISLQGRNLQDTTSILFRSPKLQATVLSADPYTVKARVKIAGDAEPGRHDLRLIAKHGSAIGYFDVATFVETNESEPNNDPKKAEELKFPALVNGLVTAGDYDFFRFTAATGQTLTFDVLGTRNGSNADTAISILDEAGEELAYSDDYYGFKDPRIVYVFPKAGTYLLRLSGSSEAGCETCDYRLFAGEAPFAELAMPAGARQGSTVEFAVRGFNLDKAKEVTLGDGLARGTVISSKADEARVRMVIPKNAEPGAYRLHVDGAMRPAPFVISQYNEVTVADGRARSRKDPVPVTLPVVANGVIDKPKAADYFVLRVDEPKRVVLEAHAMQLDYLTDPLVVIYDENGKRLAYQDDPTTNTGKEPANMDPHLVFQLPKAGRYVAMIRDAQYRGDPSFLYRLTMKDAEPDFTIRTIGTDETLYRGRTNPVLVRVRRLEGWNAPVEVWAENLPQGVRVKPVIAEPKNTPYTGTCGETHYLDGTNIEVQFEVDQDAPLSLSEIRFRGRGVFEGRTVERTARARYFKRRIRHIGDAEEEQLRAVVADAPGVVLDVPRTLTMTKNGEASLTAIVTRLDGGGSPLEVTLETAAEGLSMQPVSVPPASTRADLKLRASATAPGDFLLVGRVNGTVIGKSHPVRVRRQP
ncbi:MAG TPA: PPC domain-containing protein [Bryobacteraceae bacterium]|nr:PPC domain-containing protein [Bryobacteraceae bacterium]